jgi:hypothetical protein
MSSSDLPNIQVSIFCDGVAPDTKYSSSEYANVRTIVNKREHIQGFLDGTTAFGPYWLWHYGNEWTKMNMITNSNMIPVDVTKDSVLFVTTKMKDELYMMMCCDDYDQCRQSSAVFIALMCVVRDIKNNK